MTQIKADRINNINLQVSKSSIKEVKIINKSKNNTTNIDITPKANKLALEVKNNKTPSIDLDKVKQIKDQINNNEYEINYETIAQKLLDNI